MAHCDDADLALIALGETAGPADQLHLAQCADCRRRLDELTAVVATGRSVSPADRLVAPPDSVWAGITEELSRQDPAAPEELAAPSDEGAVVVPLDAARRRRGLNPGWLAAAAVVGIVVGSVATVTLTGGSSSSQLVASASLEPVADSPYRGTAALEQQGGESVLRVSVPDLPAVEDGYYEVWMATADAATMVAVGTLSPGEDAVLTLPAGMQTADFPLVDVSVEHYDGDAGHSAVSVVRGLLPA